MFDYNKKPIYFYEWAALGKWYLKYTESTKSFKNSGHHSSSNRFVKLKNKILLDSFIGCVREQPPPCTSYEKVHVSVMV